MMKKLAKVFTILSMSFMLIGSSPVMAQCPMCKAAVVSEHSGGKSKLAEGLNNGILYMFVLPYAMVMGVGILWYRGYKRKKRLLESEEKEL